MDPLRGRLLAEATRLFVERGFAGVSMQAIADACGVTKAALYYHYAGKAELLRDIVGEYLDAVAGVVEVGRYLGGSRETSEAEGRSLRSSRGTSERHERSLRSERSERHQRSLRSERSERLEGTSAAQLSAIVHGLFALPIESRAVMRLAMHDLRHLPDADRDAFGADYRTRFVGPLAAIVAEGAASGEFAPRDPMTVVWLLLGMLYPFFSTHQVADEDAAVADLLDVLINGLAAR